MRPYYSRKPRPVPKEEYNKYQVVAVDDPDLARKLDAMMLALELAPQLVSAAVERAEAQAARSSAAAAAAASGISQPQLALSTAGVQVDVPLNGAMGSPHAAPAGCKCLVM